MSVAASAHPAPKPCGFTQDKLIDLLKEADKNAIRFDRYFFTNNTYASQVVPSQFLPRDDLLPDMPRCRECGKTIGEHLPDSQDSLRDLAVRKARGSLKRHLLKSGRE